MIVAIKERSAGNESIGEMWLETKVFPDDTPVVEIVHWGNGQQRGGKLIISLPEVAD